MNSTLRYSLFQEPPPGTKQVEIGCYHKVAYHAKLFFDIMYSFGFIWSRFVSFRFVSFRFVSFRFVSFRFVSFRFVSFRFVSFRFVSFRFVSFR